jgi:hypothetical protein
MMPWQLSLVWPLLLLQLLSVWQLSPVLAWHWLVWHGKAQLYLASQLAQTAWSFHAEEAQILVFAFYWVLVAQAVLVLAKALVPLMLE